jgi:hypothetical protein
MAGISCWGRVEDITASQVSGFPAELRLSGMGALTAADFTTAP